MSRDQERINQVINIVGEYPVNASPDQIKKGRARIDTASQPSNSDPFGVLFLVATAFIVVIVAGIGFGSQNGGNTGISPTQAFSQSGQQPQNSITIANSLLRPVQISFNSTYQGNIQAGQTLSWSIPYSPIEVSFRVIPIYTTGGRPFGDEMGGVFRSVTYGANLRINNVIGSDHYFYPQFTNNTNFDCDISINNGYVNENRPGTLEAHTQNIVAGYFRFFNNTNVTLFCNNGQIYYWGSQPGKPVTPISYVQPDTGFLTLILDP